MLRLDRTIAMLALAFVAFGPRALAVAWPSAIMIHGGALNEPIVVATRAISDTDTYLFLYGGAKKVFGKDLSGRPYFDLAMFWDGEVWKAIEADAGAVKKLRPADAKQHGRLYPPFGNEPAAVVATPLEAGSACSNEEPCGWTLGPREIGTLRSLKVPGF